MARDRDPFSVTTKVVALRDESGRGGTAEMAPVGRGQAQLIVLVGPGAGRTFAIKDETVIGRSPEAQLQLVTDDVSRRHARIYRTGAGPLAIQDLDSRNGTLVNGIAIKDQVLQVGDKIRIGTGTILMYSQLDELDAQLRQSQKMEAIGRLAGGVAHDFNNLLCVILANASSLRGLGPKTSLGHKDVMESIADIESAGRRAAELTRQLLGFARRGSLERRPVELGALLDEIRHLISRTFPKHVRIEMQTSPDAVVLGDASQLHQVLMNLAINARDAMPQGGTLSIAADLVRLREDEVLTLPFLMPGAFVVISITDTGMGMDAETLRRAFEPFFTTKGGQGTGMGLATAYGIVKNHGGHIQVASEPGRGTTFKIYLPAVERPTGQASVAFERVNPLETGKVSGGIMLVVEDEELLRNSARRLLEGMGFAVLVAGTGTEAIKVFREHGALIRYVLLDLALPGASGVDVFHALRGIKPEVKVLLTSGQPEVQSVQALLAAGAVAFLQKPYDAGTLAEAMSRAMHGR